MNWFHWVLIALFALNSLCSIWMIGRNREPITPGVSATTVILNTALAFGVVYYR